MSVPYPQTCASKSSKTTCTPDLKIFVLFWDLRRCRFFVFFAQTTECFQKNQHFSETIKDSIDFFEEIKHLNCRKFLQRSCEQSNSDRNG